MDREPTALFGGCDSARYIHFFCMAAIALFLVVHLSLALLMPKVVTADDYRPGQRRTDAEPAQELLLNMSW